MNERITIDPDVLSGKPIVSGTRISVEFVVGLLAQGWSVEDVLKEYDHLTPEDIQASLTYPREEAAKGRREDFQNYLAAVPVREPDAVDRMPQ
jgi:uncharacterized protein (DUF433 family)